MLLSKQWLHMKRAACLLSSVKVKLLCGSRSSDCTSSHVPNTGLIVTAVVQSGMKLKMQVPCYHEVKIYAALSGCSGQHQINSRAAAKKGAEPGDKW